MNVTINLDDFSNECRRILAHEASSLEILDKLAKDEDKHVRQEVAINPNTSSNTLDKLAKDEDKCVRQAVARNPNTSSNTLDKLSKDFE